MPLERSPQRRDHLVPLEKDTPHVGIGDQVEVALTVARFDVLQTVPFLGHRQNCFGQKLQLLRTHRQLAGSRAEHRTLNADNVARVQLLVDGELCFAYGVLAHVDLQLDAPLLDMAKAGLALSSDGRQAAADAHRGFILFQLLGPGVVVVIAYLRERMGEGELTGIGLETELFDVANLLKPLLEQTIFGGQGDVLRTGP